MRPNPLDPHLRGGYWRAGPRDSNPAASGAAGRMRPGLGWSGRASKALGGRLAGRAAPCVDSVRCAFADIPLIPRRAPPTGRGSGALPSELMRWAMGVAVAAALSVAVSACGGSARVGGSHATHSSRVYVEVAGSMDCYSGALLSLSAVERAFANAGVPLRQTDPPHGHLDWLALRQRLPKNDFAWLWLNTVPYQPCGENQTVHVKNLEIAYQTPPVLSRRIRSALNALRRVPVGSPPGALTVSQVESAFAREGLRLSHQPMTLSGALLGASGLSEALLKASGVPEGAALVVLVHRQPGQLIIGPGRWPTRERNFANVSVAYDLSPQLATHAEAAISRLRAESSRG